MRLIPIALLCLVSSLAAAEAPPPARDCSAEGFRRLDYWIGNWTVATPDGQPAGHNRIERELGGCVLLEHWTGFDAEGRAAQRGFGMHRYDRVTDHWLQAWAFDTGDTYDLVGHLEGARMIYDHVARKPGPKRRSTLELLPDGRVEQKGERWDEASQRWETTFHLLYTRAP
jgi:hypothetical protein